MVKLSVIIPVYNRGKRLCRAVNSVINQNIDNLEIIVVDDGSDTDVLKFISEKNKNSIQFYSHDINRGANAARNTGFEQSSGEYILYLDSDDMLRKNVLKQGMNSLMNSSERIGAAFFSYVNIHEKFNNEKNVCPVIKNGTYELKDYEDSKVGNPIGGFSSVIFKRKSINSISKLDENMPSSQDIDTYLQLLRTHDFVGIDKILAIRDTKAVSLKMADNKVDSDQISHNYKKKARGSLRLIDKHCDILSDELIAKRYYSVAWFKYNLSQVDQAKAYFRRAAQRYPYSLSHLYYYAFSRMGSAGIKRGIQLERQLT